MKNFYLVKDQVPTRGFGLSFLLLCLFTLVTNVNVFGQCEINISNGEGTPVELIDVCQGESVYLTVGDEGIGLPAGTLFNWGAPIFETTYSVIVTPTTNALYKVTVTYPDGCEATDEVQVNVSVPPVALITVTDATCGGNDGVLSVTGGGGTPPYSYTWSGGFTGDNLTNIPSGSYTVTITDDIGCSGTAVGVVDVSGNMGVSGTVYGDYNYDATNNQVFQGYAGLVVNLYDNNNTIAYTTTTDGNGFYQFNPDFTNGDCYRMEFDIPDGHAVTTNGVTATGGDVINNTQVRFLCGPSCSENLAISVPTDYCHTDDPTVVVACYVNGDPLLGGTAGTLDAIVSTNYNNEGFPGGAGYSAPTHEAISSEVGSLYGIAYDRVDKNLFYGAYLKRHVGLGTEGLGGIYIQDIGNGGASAPYIDVTDFGVNVGTVTGRDLPANYGSPSYDIDAFSKVGKVGLGDIDISDNGDTLYVMNLFNRSMVLFDISDVNNPVYVSEVPVPVPPGCSAAEWRPFGLKYYGGRVYASGTCSGEFTGNVPEAHVFKYNPNTGFIAAPILSFPFDYTRDAAFGCSAGVGHPGDFWYSWDDTDHGSAYPQPIFADLEFEVDGSMIIGIRDRNADQYGFRNYPPIAGSTSLVSALSVGDILRADPVGGGFYQLENNGVSQGKTGCGANSNEGPGGGEFFCGDLKLCHNEAATGALAKFAGSGEVLSTVYDPHRSYSQGFSRFNSIDGSAFEGYEVFRDVVASGIPNDIAGFGKANGLGDLEVLCDAAPIEVGDYVWIDSDNDGIQDPNETPIANATITLYKKGANNAKEVIGTTTTDSRGYYYFYDLEVQTDYYVVLEGAIDPAAGNYVAYDDANGGLNINGISLEPSVVDVNNNTNDLIDNDSRIRINGVPASVVGIPSIEFTTGLPGDTDHSLDFGLFGCDVEIQCAPDVAICLGQCVILTNNIVQGVGPYTYKWSTNEITENIEVCPAISTTYTVTVTDALDCTGVCDINVNVENGPILGIDGPAFTCTETSVQFCIPNPDPNATYVWDFGCGIVDDGAGDETCETVTFPASCSNTNVTVTLTGTGGDLFCESSDETTIQVGGVVEVNAGPDKTACPGESVTIGGTPAFVAPQGGTILWSPATHLNSTTISNPTVTLPTGVNSMTYTVTVTNNGCTATDEVTVTSGLCSELGDRIWFDTNADGVQDPGEVGIAGINVTLTGVKTGTGAAVSISMLTSDGTQDVDNDGIIDPIGYYNFTNLTPGSYVVSFDTPDGFSNSPINEGGDDTTDSDFAAGAGVTAVTQKYVIVPGDDNNDVDGGIYPCQELNGTVFTDTNNDGCRDNNEAGIANVNATLYECPANGNPPTAGTGTALATTTTDNNGDYIFDMVCLSPAKEYYVEFDKPANHFSSPEDSNECDDTSDSDADENGQTDCTDPNSPDDNVDAGFSPCLDISGTAWSDTDSDGCQDLGEAAIPNVSVTLYECDPATGNPAPVGTGTEVASTTTGSDGSYLFECLDPAKEYYIEMSTPAGHDGPTQEDSNACTDDTDSDIDPDGQSPCTPPGDPNNPPGPDGGFVPTDDVKVSIGSMIFVDDNNNGQLDGTEAKLTDPSKLNMVTVFLYEDTNGNGTIDAAELAAPVASTGLDADGTYYFGDLEPGDYAVGFTPPASLSSSSTGNAGDNQVDNDDNGIQATDGASIISPIINLTPGTEPVDGNEMGSGSADDNVEDNNGDMTVDFGLYEPAAISGDVTEDTDNDDLGEVPIGGVTITLIDKSDGSTVATTTTNTVPTDLDGDGIPEPIGDYYFGGLAPGNYTVVEGQPADYTSVSDFDESPDGDPTDGNDPQNDAIPVTLTSGEIDEDNDFVEEACADLSGYVWLDSDLDGCQDANEDPIADVTVNLFECPANGVPPAAGTVAPLATTDTDEDGNYLFDDCLDPNKTYYVEFTAPANLFPTTPDSGNCGDATDSDADADGQTDCVDPNGPGPDGGFTPCLDIAGYAWSDDNADGCQDAGEAPIANVNVTLYECDPATGVPSSNGSDPLVSSTSTDADGTYLFDCLDPTKEYYVDFGTPSGYNGPTTEDSNGCTDATDSDIDVNGQSDCTPPGDPNNPPGPDGGFIPNEGEKVSIGSMIFVDTNNNGQLDGDEAKLTDPTKLNMVTVFLYEDTNNNNVIDAAELAAPVASTTVDPDGTYFFDNLDPGDYAVGFTPPASLSSSSTGNAGDNQVDNDDNGIQTTDGASIISPVINLAPGTEPIDGNEAGSGSADDNAEDNNGDMTIDFGLYEPASISGLVSEDTDNNDTPDQPIPGVTLTLIDKTTGATVATTTTNAVPTDLDGDGVDEPIGAYYFGDLAPGTYTVVETQPNGFTSVSDEDGSNDGDPTDGNDPTNDSIPVILISGEDDEDNDFVEEALGTISGMVSEDTNNDDTGDVPLDGVTITLIDKSNGATVATVQTADGVTDDLNNDGFIDPKGYYFFGDLPAGNYTVVETQPTGLESVSDQDESNDGDPNDGNDPVNDSIPVVLGAGENDDDNDFVEENLGSISGTVSEDTDNDDVADTPIGGVTLTLIDKTTGATVATVITNTVPTDLDGDGILEPVGAYYFGDVPPGTYTVVETQPNGYDSVSDQDESNDGDPSDGNDPVNNAIPVVVTPGEDDTDNDFIEEQGVSIGSMVFIDSNNNGVLDGSESKLTDPAKLGQITIELYEDANGNGTIDAAELAAPVATTPLNADGTYYFGGLEPGDYAVGFTPPASLSSSSTGNGGDDETDNDDNGIQSADGASIISSVIELSPGTEPTDGAEAGSGALADNGADDNGDMTIDFGLFEPAAISGMVGEDTNNDGVAEVPISGVTLTLIDKSNGATVATTTTNTVPTDLDGDGVAEPVGAYYFGDLLPGNYTVVETQPTGYDSVSDEDGSNDGDPSDAGDPTNDAIPVTLVSGETDEDNDFVEERGSISGKVTEDTDNDDFGDVPLAGTSVTLIDKTTGAIVASMNTISVPTDLDGDGVLEPIGSYYFGSLPAGNYTVLQNDSALTDYTDVKDGDDSADGDATDGIYNTDDAISVTLGAGEDDEDNNFVEETPLGSISGNVTVDTNDDGLGDTPLANVPLALIDKTTGATVATTVTDGTGAYSFSGLPAGTYTVVETDLPGYTDVSDEDESNDGDPNDGNDPVNDAIPVVLGPGENDSDNNFVEEPIDETGSISGTVTEDTNNDDIGDTPLTGVTLTLIDKSTGATVATVVTANGTTDDLDGDGVVDPAGSYYFGNVPAGTYTVVETDPVGYSDVSDQDESNDGDPSDGNDPVNDAIPVVLAPGEDDTDNDFVEEVNLSIGSLIWNDEDNDGIKDANEVGIAGILVQVYEDADGNGLPDDLNGNGILDAGDVVGSDVTGFEIDTDGDGIADDNNNDGVIEPLGTYYIDQLPAGDYVVMVATAPMTSKQDGQPVSMISSDNTNLVDDQTDNDDNGRQLDTDGDGIKDGPTVSPTITLAAGTEPMAFMEFGDKEDTNPVDTNGDNTVDFGFYIPGHIGNLVWVDSQTDGVGNNVYDAGEILVDGATVYLYEDVNGNGVLDPAELAAPLQTTTTDAFGEYEFSGLAPGVDYIVVFDQMTATNVPGTSLTFIPTFSPSSLLDDNSNVDPSCGCTESISISSGERNSTIDAGLSTNSVVSLSLVDFYGRYNSSKDVNEVTWITINEANTDKFIVERSFENTNDFIAIGEVQGNENSTQEITYNFDDSDISQSGLYIYRLRQVDTDGRQSVEGPIGIRVQREVKTSVNVYPNPATNEVTFEITSAENADMKVTMYNVAGKVVVPNFASTTLESGNNKLTVNLSSVPSGSYVLRIQIADKAYIKKLSVID